MLNSQKKDAFTIFETLIVVSILAVLVILSFKIFRTADEKAYPKLYAKAFNTLNVATYNIQKDVDDFNAEKDLEAQESGKSGAEDSEKRRFPNVQCNGDCETTPVSEAQLCEALTGDEEGYMNVTGTPSCGVSQMAVFMQEKPELPEPSFKTTDGMNYYLVSSPDDKYFVVFVDISGDRAPNTGKFVKGKKRPDIVPFTIYKETGVVTPQGYPIYDGAYMVARVISADPELDKDYSIPITFYEGQQIAFGGKTWDLDSMSYSMESSFTDSLPEGFQKPTADSSITTKLKCNEHMEIYDTKRDFPPCTVEVNTFMKR